MLVLIIGPCRGRDGKGCLGLFGLPTALNNPRSCQHILPLTPCSWAQSALLMAAMALLACSSVASPPPPPGAPRQFQPSMKDPSHGLTPVDMPQWISLVCPTITAALQFRNIPPSFPARAPGVHQAQPSQISQPPLGAHTCDMPP
jgi:hypothetical protein